MKYLLTSVLILSAFNIQAYATESDACLNLFSESEIERSIGALANLRVKIDTALATGAIPISIKSLIPQYRVKQEKLIANSGMPRSEFLSKLAKEINLLQTAQGQADKATEAERQNEIKIDKFFVDGSKAVFLPFKPTANETSLFGVMATPVTEEIYKKISNLINRKLHPKFRIEGLDLTKEGSLRPIGVLSFHSVTRWIQGLNELSKLRVSDLNLIIANHIEGVTYRLPTKEEWWDFVTQANVPLENAFLPPFTSRMDESVVEKLPMLVQNLEYYGLSGFISIWMEDGSLFSPLPKFENGIFMVTGRFDQHEPVIRQPGASIRLFRQEMGGK